jgi:hypothetical protein
LFRCAFFRVRRDRGRGCECDRVEVHGLSRSNEKVADLCVLTDWCAGRSRRARC